MPSYSDLPPIPVMLSIAVSTYLTVRVAVAEVAASAGFSDPLYFSRVFRKKYGISPSEYSKG